MILVTPPLVDRGAALVAALPEGRVVVDPQVLVAFCAVVIGTFGHAGDGNLHPTIVYDATDPAQVLAARDAFDRIVTATLELGGTLTGEHGVGLLKRPYLDQQLGTAERALMGRIKAAFDPAGLLNPGKAL